jgi:hypothetical protein
VASAAGWAWVSMPVPYPNDGRSAAVYAAESVPAIKLKRGDPSVYGVQCDLGLMCGPSGQCTPLKPDGATCSSYAECLGVCRNGTCAHDSVCSGG